MEWISFDRKSWCCKSTSHRLMQTKILSAKSRYHLSKWLLFDQVPLPPTASNVITLATIPVTTTSGSVKPWMVVVRRLLTVNDAKGNVHGNSIKKALKDPKLYARQQLWWPQEEILRSIQRATHFLQAHWELLKKHKHSYRCMLVEEAKSCMELLEQTALKPSPLTQADYIQLMIDSEKSEKGRMGRASNPS